MPASKPSVSLDHPCCLRNLATLRPKAESSRSGKPGRMVAFIRHSAAAQGRSLRGFWESVGDYCCLEFVFETHHKRLPVFAKRGGAKRVDMRKGDAEER